MLVQHSGENSPGKESVYCFKCTNSTLISACFFFKDWRSVVGGLLLRGMSNRVVTPPVAAADVAAAMPAQPHEAVCFDLNVQA